MRRSNESYHEAVATGTRALEVARKSANDLVEQASNGLRSKPTLLAAVCEAYDGQRRPNVDPLPDLIDAAVAEHARHGTSARR